MMTLKYKLTYRSGTATAYLINNFHTPKGAKLQLHLPLMTANVIIGFSSIMQYISHSHFNSYIILSLFNRFNTMKTHRKRRLGENDEMKMNKKRKHNREKRTRGVTIFIIVDYLNSLNFMNILNYEK